MIRIAMTRYNTFTKYTSEIRTIAKRQITEYINTIENKIISHAMHWSMQLAIKKYTDKIMYYINDQEEVAALYVENTKVWN